MSSLKFSGGGFSRFISGKGFYAALAVCLIGAGAAAWVAVNKTLNSLEYRDDTYQGSSSSFFTIEEETPELPVAPSQPTQEAAANVTGEPKASSSSSSSAPRQESSSKPQSQPPAQSGSSAPSPNQPASVYVLPIDGEIFNPFSGGELVKNETLNKWMTHNGIDIKADKGAQVISIADNGKVLSVKDTALWGTVVTVEYPGKIVASYYGLDKDVAVKKDDSVKIKQKIGVIGQIPAEIIDAPHLHFEIRRDGKLADPMEVLGKKAE